MSEVAEVVDDGDDSNEEQEKKLMITIFKCEAAVPLCLSDPGHERIRVVHNGSREWRERKRESARVRKKERERARERERPPHEIPLDKWLHIT